MWWFGAVTQWLECQSYKLEVDGSNPSGSTKQFRRTSSERIEKNFVLCMANPSGSTKQFRRTSSERFERKEVYAWRIHPAPQNSFAVRLRNALKRTSCCAWRIHPAPQNSSAVCLKERIGRKFGSLLIRVLRAPVFCRVLLFVQVQDSALWSRGVCDPRLERLLQGQLRALSFL